MNEKRVFLISLFLIVSLLFIGSCSQIFPKFYPPYVDFSPQKLTQVKRILIIGPNLKIPGSSSISKEEKIRIESLWQKKIITQYNKEIKDESQRYTLIYFPEATAKFVNLESQIKLPPKYDEKTGKLNTNYLQVYTKELHKIIQQLCREYKVDGILYTDFVVLYPPLQMNGSIVCWDGAFANPAKTDIRTILWGISKSTGGESTAVSFSGKIPVLSLRLKLYDHKGDTILEGRAGYRPLQILDFVDLKTENLDFTKVFDPDASWNKKYSKLCISIAAKILAKPKKLNQKAVKYRKEMEKFIVLPNTNYGG